MDPKLAAELAEQTRKAAERDLYSTLFVVALVIISVMAVYIVRLHQRIDGVQGLRVEEQKAYVGQNGDNIKRAGETSMVVMLRLQQFEQILFAAYPKLAHMRNQPITTPGEMLAVQERKP